jgi:hypothetical protein
VAIHVLRALPTSARGELANQLVDAAGKNAADVLHRVHLALELDGRAHDYAAHEWLPVVYDVATPLLESARLDREPPSVVQHAQEAVGWLASAVINLDQDSAERRLPPRSRTPSVACSSCGCSRTQRAITRVRATNSVHSGFR